MSRRYVTLTLEWGKDEPTTDDGPPIDVAPARIETGDTLPPTVSQLTSRWPSCAARTPPDAASKSAAVRSAMQAKGKDIDNLSAWYFRRALTMRADILRRTADECTHDQEKPCP